MVLRRHQGQPAAQVLQPDVELETASHLDTFIRATSGRPAREIDSKHHDAFLQHLGTLSNSTRLEWSAILDGRTRLVEAPSIRRLKAFSEIAELIQDHGSISIRRILQFLEGEHTDVHGTQPYTSVAPIFVFTVVGFLSLLYKPASVPGSDEMCIEVQNSSATIKHSVSMDLVARPLHELLYSFGNLIPHSRLDDSDHARDAIAAMSPLKFEVSYLNMATMCEMARMQIIWVDTISEHLLFDSSKPSICIFKCPSFCKIAESEQSVSSM